MEIEILSPLGKANSTGFRF